MRYIATIGFIGVALTGCDTASNVDDPNLKSYTRYIGTDGNQTGRDIVMTADGSMVLLGNTDASGFQQLYIVKTTAEGYVLWEKSIGSNEEARDAELLSNGRIGILSMTMDANRDFKFRQITVDGALTDSVTYGVPGFAEEAYTLTETGDSYLVAGYTTNVPAPDPADAMVVRFAKDLTLYPSWTTTIGGDSDFDVAIRAFEVGQDFYLFGHTNAIEPGSDAVLDYNAFVWVVNSFGVNKAGPFLIGNSEIVGSSASADEAVSAVTLDPNGGYVLSGHSVDRVSRNQQMFAMRIIRNLENNSPNDIDKILVVPPVAFGSTSASATPTSGTSIFPSQGVGFLILASESLASNENIYLKRLDNDLTDAWDSPTFFSFGGIGTDTPGAVTESPVDGRIILLGTMILGESDTRGQQKMVLMKLSSDGKLGR